MGAYHQPILQQVLMEILSLKSYSSEMRFPVAFKLETTQAYFECQDPSHLKP